MRCAIAWNSPSLQMRSRHSKLWRTGAIYPGTANGYVALRKRSHIERVTGQKRVHQWAQAMVRTDRRLINGVAGAIGPATPSAVAAKLYSPDDPVIVATAGLSLRKAGMHQRHD